MKWFSPMYSQRALAVICGVGMASGIAAFPAHADEWNKKTVLTVNEPIQVTDKVLDPGKYVLMLADSNSDRHIVRIFDESQKHLIDTVQAIPNYRLQPTGNSRFSFWETPPGTAKALRAWFYPGDNFGQEFRYPAHPAVLQAQAAVAAPPVSSPAPAAEEVTPAAAPPTTSEPSVQTAPEQASEVAQNTPPPAVEPPPPAPQAEQQQPRELPQTASPYPLIGLGGLSLLGLAGLLALRRLA